MGVCAKLTNQEDVHDSCDCPAVLRKAEHGAAWRKVGGCSLGVKEWGPLCDETASEGASQQAGWRDGR